MQTSLILVLGGLLFLLVSLVFIYVWIGRSARAKTEPAESHETLETLSAIIMRKSTSNAELRRAAEEILVHFGTIERQTLPTYQAVLETLCIHPHSDSKLVLRFEKTLRHNNPNYHHEIDAALKTGLDARS